MKKTKIKVEISVVVSHTVCLKYDDDYADREMAGSVDKVSIVFHDYDEALSALYSQIGSEPDAQSRYVLVSEILDEEDGDE